MPSDTVAAEIRVTLENDTFLRKCSELVSRSRSEIELRTQTSLSEAAVGLSLLEGIDLKGKRVLEIGAGVGIVSLILHRQGIEVVPIEPGRGGFDANAQIGNCLREWLGIRDLKYLSLGAEELRADKHGFFDVIFSVNVLEHIPDLESAIEAMSSVLRPSGIMRHTCPNYLVPYEPHFGVPLVPLFPRLTAFLLPRVRGSELWKSLNFVTLGRMKRAFARQGMTCTFSRGTMHQAFARLEVDEQYRKRQGDNPSVAIAYRILRRLGLLKLVAGVPPMLATPMTFEVRSMRGNS